MHLFFDFWCQSSNISSGNAGGKSADCFDKTDRMVLLPVASQSKLNHEGERIVPNSTLIKINNLYPKEASDAIKDLMYVNDKRNLIITHSLVYSAFN